MSNLNPDWEQHLRNLSSDWDGEGADVPSEEAISKTEELVVWATQNNLNIESVDPDVLGGTGIYINGINKRTAWIVVLNHYYENPSIVVRDINALKAFSITNLEELKLFLTVE